MFIENLESPKGQSLRNHLVECHAQEAVEVAKKDDRTLDMFHFEQHDHMYVGWPVAKGTRPHTHRDMSSRPERRQ